MHIPARALEFLQARGGFGDSLFSVSKRPTDDEPIVMEELQLAGGGVRVDDGVDVVVAASCPPEPVHS